MIEIEKPKIETVEISEDAKFGKFVIEPLERGYGTYFRKFLASNLLSSLPGAAVTSFKLMGSFMNSLQLKVSSKTLHNYFECENTST